MLPGQQAVHCIQSHPDQVENRDDEEKAGKPGAGPDSRTRCRAHRNGRHRQVIRSNPRASSSINQRPQDGLEPGLDPVQGAAGQMPD